MPSWRGAINSVIVNGNGVKFTVVVGQGSPAYSTYDASVVVYGAGERRNAVAGAQQGGQPKAGLLTVDGRRGGRRIMAPFILSEHLTSRKTRDYNWG